MVGLWFFIAWLASQGAFYPPSSDVNKFPDWWVCTQQVERCQRHLEWLRSQRAGRGYEGGRWDRWLVEVEGWRQYWITLGCAHEAYMVSEKFTRGNLQLIKDMIGPDAYLRRWRPTLIPDFTPPKPMTWADP